MKSHYIILLVCILLGLLSPIAAQSSTEIGSVDINSSLPVSGYIEILDCKTDSSVHLDIPGLTLHADSGSVIDAFTLSAERLPSTDAVAPMPSGMENVTTGRAIYRLLPHGEHFIEPAVLTMEDSFNEK